VANCGGVATRRGGEQRTSSVGTAAVRRGRVGGAARAAPRIRILPSWGSVVVGCVLLAAGVGSYVLARDTSTFSVRTVEVDGASPALAAQVRHALRPLLGTSLIGLDGTELQRRVDALPDVVSTDYDRAFPHTLRVRIVAERAVAVLRTGKSAWLVSARGRLIGPVAASDEPTLPRLWEPAAMQPVAGDFLAGEAGGVAARSLGLAARFPARIRAASFAGGELVFMLRSGLELRLGDPTDIRLKLAVARRALSVLPGGVTYLDVSVPGRLVTGSGNSQVSTGG
jgi:cell division protein FtsQ